MGWTKRAALLLAALVLAACGGTDGSGGSSSSSSASRDDARNGDYTVYAADARQYQLRLDFDRRTWRMRGDGFSYEQSGTFAADGGTFTFQGSTATTGTNTARFQSATDAVIGGFRFDAGVLPFVAARTFVASVAEAAGVYNIVARITDTAGLPNTAVFAGEITSGGQLRTCLDATIPAIANCPSSSVTSGNLTVSGTEFTSDTSAGTFRFRIARIGSERVLLRAGAATGTTGQFWVGTPATAAFAQGSFAGANSEGQWSTSTIGPTSHSATLLSAGGGTSTRTGSAAPAGESGTGLGSLLRLATTTNGPVFFAVRNGVLAALVAARDNTVTPGLIEVGKAQ